jgi:hypothetical protein
VIFRVVWVCTPLLRRRPRGVFPGAASTPAVSMFNVNFPRFCFVICMEHFMYVWRRRQVCSADVSPALPFESCICLCGSRRLMEAARAPDRIPETSESENPRRAFLSSGYTSIRSCASAHS